MKLRKLFLAAGLALVAAGATAQVNVEDIRIYINPGHGAFDADSRPCGTVKHGANNAYTDVNNDTSNFFESNTNLNKGLALFHKLKEFGFKHEDGKSGLDLTQNIVMSRIQSGAVPAYIDYENHTVNPESEKYDRSLSEISAEVEFNNFDMFICIHSNAASSTNTNYPLVLYRGTDSEEYNAGAKAMSTTLWPHLYGQGHHQWTYYSMTSMNLRGDVSFYGGSSRVKYVINDPDYVFVEGPGREFLEGADGAPDTIAYTSYLGALKHGAPGYLSEGYFHTYEPARHRYMNRDVCYLEGEAYAWGVNDYFGLGNTNDEAIIYGVLRDKDEKFQHEFYNPNVSTNDKYLPLNNATVKLLDAEGNEVATYTTDDEYNGVFVFRVAPGTYSLTYSLEGYNEPEAEFTEQFTVAAGDKYYPEAFLRNVNWVPPTKVYVNYPDSTAGKTGYSLFPSYEIKSAEISILAEQLADKTVRRQIIRDDKLYVLALDAANEPYIYLADLAAATVDTLDTDSVKMGANGFLKISDIALTADHVLVASGYSQNHASDDIASGDGVTRGSVNFYKWSQDSITALPDSCELWFTSISSVMFNRGNVGKTLAYSGTLENGTLTASCHNGSSSSDIGMRFNQFAIAEGQMVGETILDSWDAVPNETNFYPDLVSSNADNWDFEIMVSPLGNNNNFVLDGDLIAPFEWSTDGNEVAYAGVAAILIGRNEAVSSVKANGANYFRYAGKVLMVTPKVNAEGLVEGVQMFDISEGFAAAKEIALEGAAIEPTAYTYASAHGELALEQDAEENTIGASIELFLAVDGKVYKFTETDNFETFEPADGGTANPFAYALESSIADQVLSISYALNADATDVNINVKDAEGNVVATSAEGAKAKGTYTAEISIAEFEDGDYTWEVEVAGAEKTAVETFASYMFYHPRGVEVDNNTESPSFGNIYVTEGMTSSLEQYHSNTTTSGGLGLYAFNAAVEPILNPATGKYGFNGGWTLSYKAGSSNAADLARVRVAEDGRLFVTRMNDAGDYIMYAPSFEDLYENNEFTSLFTGLTFDAATYKYTDANGNFITASNLGFDVKGAGEDLKLLALSCNINSWSYVFSGGSLDEFALGTAATLPAPTNIPALTGKYTIAPASTNVEYDDRGGIWYCQYRGTPTDAQPGLVYIDKDGNEKYKDLVSRGGGGVRVSPDGKQIAVASSSAAPKQFTIYDLIWAEDGTPALRKVYTITHNIGTNVYDIAWDLAGNIYICGNSGEYFKAFALPRTEAFTTKAAAKYGFTVGTSSVIDIEVNEDAPAEYYNLQGVKVANPANGIYIVKRGNKVTKEYVK
ncbi:MAG: hypothetical protein IKL83_07240 [Muribaculaceae bacterium]|nr:hypothetical protein [Muribaculaceae bacterium]